MTERTDLAPIIESYRKASKRLIFLDYDGTLVMFNDMPERSTMDDGVRMIVRRLSSDPNNRVYIISGRTRAFLSVEFTGMNVGLIAEHGYVKKELDEEWKVPAAIPDQWKIAVLELFRQFCTEYPGTFVEDKESSVAFHYRNSPVNNIYAKIMDKIREPFQALVKQFPELELLDGIKVLEIKPAGFDKGQAGYNIVRSGSFDFIMAVGDDLTDEHLFVALPPGAFTIKIGDPPTAARFCLHSRTSFIKLLQELAG